MRSISTHIEIARVSATVSARASSKRPCALVDACLRYLWVSSGYAKLVGYPSSEIPGKFVSEILGEENVRTQIKPLFEKALSGEIVEFSAWISLPGSGEHFVRRRYSPAEHDLRPGDRLIWVEIDDLSELAEQVRLRESEKERLTKISSLFPGVLYQFVKRPDGTFSVPYVSEGLLNLFTLDPEQIKDDAQPFLELGHPEEIPENIASVGESEKDLSTWSRKLRLLTRSGEYRWFQGYSKPERRPDGSILWNGVLYDIHEQEKNREELEKRVSFEHLISGLSSRLNGVKSESLDDEIQRSLSEVGSFTRVDRAYLFQFSEDQYLVSNTHEWCGNGIEPQIEGLQNERVDEFSYVLPRILKGKDFWFQSIDELPAAAARESEHFQNQQILSMLIVPVRDGERVIGFIGFDSVKEHRRWTDPDRRVLRLLADTLGNLLSRTSAERQLLEAEAKAREANAAKMQFLAAMSHDLRTPLNAIIGFQQILSFDETDAERRTFLEEINRGAQRLLEMISDLLEYAKVDAGKLSVQEESFRVQDLLNDELALFRSQLESKKIPVECNCESIAHEELSGPLRALRQVLLNLISNAIKYSQNERIEIEASVEAANPQDQENLQLNCTVRDFGEPIPWRIRESIERVFNGTQDFVERADGSGGVGIGLSICKRICDQVGGSITLETQREGVGAEFTFIVPVKSKGQRADDSFRESPRIPEYQPRNLGGKFPKVLLVEDEVTNARTLSIMLRQLNVEVEVATTIAEAKVNLTDQRIDALLCDIRLGSENGTDLIKAIRFNELNNTPVDLPIAVLTAYAIPGDKERFLKAGADKYLSKPVKRDDLIAVLNDFLPRTEF